MPVKRARARDKRLQFERVALPHLDALYTVALRLSRNPDDAKDLLQDTILRAFRFFHQFRAGTNCRAWLLTILYNNFRNRYRRGIREQLAASNEDFEHELESQSLLADPAVSNPEALLSGRMVGRQIEAALATLPEDFREALFLVDVQELNYQEVADTLDIPIGTVKSRVSRARALMREALHTLANEQGKTGT
ncbi:MAG: sigma-70 family RNA polymerase sigma factor [Candidatus Binataceae bacterium]